MAIRLDIGANVSDAESGLTKLASGIESVGDVLDGLSKSGSSVSRDLVKSFLESERAAKSSADDIERTLTKSYGVPADEARKMSRIVKGEFEEISSSVEDVADDLEEDMTDAFDKTADESKRMASEVADNADHGFKEAADSGTNAAEDVGQAVGELGRSVGEGMDSASDGISTVGDLLSDVIPGAAGLAVGALAGVAAGFVGNWEESSEQTKELISNMYEDMIESGNDYVSQDFVNNSIKELIEDEGRLKEAIILSKIAGVDESDAIRALAGDQDALASVISTVNDRYDTLLDKKSRTAGEQAELNALRETKDKLNDVANASDTAASKADRYRDATTKSAASSQTAAEKAKGVKDAIDAIPESKKATVTVEADTGPIDRAIRNIDGRTVRVNMIANQKVPIL